MTQGDWNQQQGYGQGQPGAPSPGGRPSPYGQPGQGQPGGRPQGAYPPQGQPGGYGGPARSGPAFGVVGAVLAAIGAVAGIIAFTATNWYHGGSNSHYSDVHKALTALDKAPYNAANGLSVAYFSYLAWVLLGVGVVTAIAANLPTPASGALRTIGAIVGVAGIVITLLSIQIVSKGSVAKQIGAPDGFVKYLKSAAKAPSLYLSLGGFLLITIGALIGPKRRSAY